MPPHKRTILYNGLLVLPDRVLTPGVVVIENDGIVTIQRGPTIELEADAMIDLDGRYLASGFIALHIHGANGIDFIEATGDGLARISQFLVQRGVTRYLPTTVPVDEKQLSQVINTVGDYHSQQPSDRAQMLGIHFEGPFVNANRCGALHAKHFKTFTLTNAKNFICRFPIF